MMPGNATAQFQEPSRLRPSTPLQRPGALGLLLESGLLPALYAEARLHGLSALDVALAPDGQLTLFCAGLAVDPASLEGAVAGTVAESLEVLEPRTGFPLPEGAPHWASSSAWAWLQANAAGLQVDAWAGGRQWHLLVAEGVWLGRLAQVRRPEPIPFEARSGLRLRLQGATPRSGSEMEAEAMQECLLEQLHGLAVTAPGLVVTVQAAGLTRRLAYPRGLEQRVRELSWGRPLAHAEPLVLEARWQGLRARCALQWCLDGQTRLVGYQDGRRTGAADTAIQVLLSTARAGLAMHAGCGLREVTQARLLRGLTAVVALDALRANQVGELGLEQLSPEGSALHGEALHSEAVAALTPLLVRALSVHPEAAQLRAWVVD